MAEPAIGSLRPGLWAGVLCAPPGFAPGTPHISVVSVCLHLCPNGVRGPHERHTGPQHLGTCWVLLLGQGQAGCGRPCLEAVPPMVTLCWWQGKRVMGPRLDSVSRKLACTRPSQGAL